MNSAGEYGLVIANLGASLLVEDTKGQIFKCHSRRKFDVIVSGDRVLWTALENHTGVIESISPRLSVLSRINKQGKAKPLAANIDLLVIVSTTKPLFDQRLIDTYLVVAENMKVDSLLVFNKSDLFNEIDLEIINEAKATYENIGYPVLTTTRNNLSSLRSALAGHTSILIGQSGVGKSTIIKSLLPDADIRIGALSKADTLGSHTTTTTMLYHLESGGNLLDSPGVREFIPDNLSKENIRHGFKEFQHYADQCRFRNCSHSNEPACAIIDAVKQNKISKIRYKNYLNLLSSSE